MSGAILITGAAGFIGCELSRVLLARGEQVVGLDNLNDYYDPKLKEARLARLTPSANFKFERVELADRAAVQELFSRHRFTRIVNLAAQAGVRYSLINPYAYVDTNVIGFLNLLEAARANPVQHFVYASSSSVYGANTKLPFAVEDRVDHPVSLYAATKRSNELMAFVFARTFGVPLTGLRFFTVYGPWGRPDMAAMIFIRAILAGEPIDVFNHGNMQRDFTYIDDIVSGVVSVLDRVPPLEAGVQHRVYNIGNHHSEPLMRFIELLCQALGRKAQMNMLPMQPGDVQATYADITAIQRDYGWKPTTSIDEGLPRLVEWYRSYYGV